MQPESRDKTLSSCQGWVEVPVLGHVLKHVAKHMIRHVPEHLLEHMPDKHVLEHLSA